MARLNAYALRVLIDWRRRAAARGEHANRVVAAEVLRPAPGQRGCVGCFRDARTLRAVGHRPGCVMRRSDVAG